MLAARQKRSSQSCIDCEYRSLRMFCKLSPYPLADFDLIGIQMMLPKGAVLFHENDPGNAVLVICNGQVKLSCTSKEGKTLILKIALPGDVLGLSAVISGSRFELTAETIEPTLVKKIRRDDYLAFLDHNPEASMYAAKALAEEYKFAFFDARRLALSGSVAGRLASVLLDWGHSASCGKPDMCFTMSLTHEDLASLTGTSRETVTRVLGKFQKEKLIQIRGSSIHILSPDRLSQLSA